MLRPLLLALAVIALLVGGCGDDEKFYSKGMLAMAKTAVEPPGHVGSQFYVVTGPDAGLPPEYAVLGKVVKRQAVVNAIGRLGDPASGGAGTPLHPL